MFKIKTELNNTGLEITYDINNGIHSIIYSKTMDECYQYIMHMLIEKLENIKTCNLSNNRELYEKIKNVVDIFNSNLISNNIGLNNDDVDWLNYFKMYFVADNNYGYDVSSNDLYLNIYIKFNNPVLSTKSNIKIIINTYTNNSIPTNDDELINTWFNNMINNEIQLVKNTITDEELILKGSYKYYEIDTHRENIRNYKKFIEVLEESKMPEN